MSLSLVTDRTTGAKYNYTDLNRVGAAISCLAGLINGYGYSVTVSTVTNWTANSIFTTNDAIAYLSNVAVIKAAFYGTTNIPAAMNNMRPEDANNIEKLLIEIEDHLTQMAAAFRYCGELICGEAQ